MSLLEHMQAVLTDDEIAKAAISVYGVPHDALDTLDYSDMEIAEHVATFYIDPEDADQYPPEHVHRAVAAWLENYREAQEIREAVLHDEALSDWDPQGIGPGPFRTNDVESDEEDDDVELDGEDDEWDFEEDEEDDVVSFAEAVLDSHEEILPETYMLLAQYAPNLVSCYPDVPLEVLEAMPLEELDTGTVQRLWEHANSNDALRHRILTEATQHLDRMVGSVIRTSPDYARYFVQSRNRDTRMIAVRAAKDRETLEAFVQDKATQISRIAMRRLEKYFGSQT